MWGDVERRFVRRLAVWIVLAYACSCAVRLLLMLDWNKGVYNHNPGTCRKLKDSVLGAGYFADVLDAQLTFISSGYAKLSNESHKGKIYVYSYLEINLSTYGPREVTMDKSFDSKNFAPLGISAFFSKGRVTLYVVNDNAGNQTVEIFLYNREQNILQHRKTISSPLFTCLSGIAVVGADRFFLTNVFSTRNHWGQLAEIGVQTSFGSMLFFDGKAIHVVEKGLMTPNGLAYDAEKGILYLSLTLAESVRVYNVGKDLSLNKTTEIYLMSSPDQIFIDSSSGDLWVACHPVMHKLLRHYMRPQKKAPSQVVRIRMLDGGMTWVVTEPYANDGFGISAASAVLMKNGTLLIGSRLSRAVQCRIDQLDSV
uniref:Paraoxonase n=1 Tax=Steinernema glaseri TaxID=37863 RepID=A0A1I7Z8A6_9BILA